jgi:hypothetical protein
MSRTYSPQEYEPPQLRLVWQNTRMPLVVLIVYVSASNWINYKMLEHLQEPF